MKLRALPGLSLLTTFFAARALLAADDLPRTQAFARYEAMKNKSPFAVATAVAPTPVAPNFAKDLYVANAAKLPDEGVVTLTSSTDKNMKEYLSTKGPNAHGYGVSSIEWSDRVGATKVTITKDGQFATLTFNQALITQPIATAPNPVPQPVQPLQQPLQQPMPQISGQITNPLGGPSNVPNAVVNPNVIKPAPIPTLPTPPPRVRGVIQRPGVVATPAPANAADNSDE